MEFVDHKTSLIVRVWLRVHTEVYTEVKQLGPGGRREYIRRFHIRNDFRNLRVEALFFGLRSTQWPPGPSQGGPWVQSILETRRV